MWEPMFNCCGGEIFLSLPIVGLIHLPQNLAALKFSFALPALLTFFLALGVANWAVLRLLTNARGWWLGALVVALTSAGVPAVLYNESFGGSLIAAFGAQPTHPELVAWLRRLPAHPSMLHRENVPVLNASEARAVADKVLSLRELWVIAGGARGLGSFSLGIKYKGIYRGGAFLNFWEPEAESELLWETFGQFYERLRASLAGVVDVDVELRKELWPPAFFVWLPGFAFAHRPDIHRDSLLDDVLARELEGLVGKGTMCSWSEQHTIVVAINVPSGGAGLSMWLLDGDKNEGRGGSGDHPDGQLTRTLDFSYVEGAFIMFQSPRYHAIAPRPQSALSLDPRIMATAYIIPCTDGNGRETLQIVNTMPSSKPAWTRGDNRFV